MGWPIVGDAIYGNAPRSGGPIMHLHAREIVVPLYKNRDPIRVTAPVPVHMREPLAACGWDGEARGADAERSFRGPSQRARAKSRGQFGPRPVGAIRMTAQ